MSKTRLVSRSESVFKGSLLAASIVACLIFFAVFVTLLVQSWPAIREFGLGFLWGTEWNPVLDIYSGLPFLVGTLLTSILALLISIPFSLSVAIFLGEYYKFGKMAVFLKSVTELLAAIPSVIYGFWGLLVLVPIIRSFEIMIGVIPYGVGIFTAAVVLSIMIIPYSASISREVINLVPNDLKEGAMSLGATRMEVLTHVILPYSKSGIIAGVLLSFGRALGETMAVTMVIGNANDLPDSIFAPGNTLASVIANEFAEATAKIHIAGLIELGLYLFVITAIVNIIGRYVIKKFSVES